MAATSPQKPPPRMEVQRALIDKDFDRYVLASDGVDRQLATLPVRVLEPLAPTHTVRKAQWDARVRFNALTADPFLSGVAYFVSADYELMQVVFSETEGLRVQKLHQLALCTSREENVSVQVAGRGLVVYSDGHGAFVFFKADGDPLDAAAWREVYECKPLGDVPTLVLGADFDAATQRFHVLVTELINYNDKDAVYRLHVIDMFSAAAAAASDAAMDVDAGAVGQRHVATEIAVLSSLPSYVSFAASELHVLVEGKHELMVELLAPPGTRTAATAATDVTEAHGAHKRHHDESELDDDGLGELLAKLPRAGIGYHGDITGIKHTHELALDLSTPLEERFHKSSTPFSSLDAEPLHSARDAAAREGKLEVPTAESILGGFEECDDVDPAASAALLRVQLASADSGSSVAVREALEINCRKFRFLCAGAQLPASPSAPTLVFQHDVHALVFAREDRGVAPPASALRHTATLPAFGFVQASKQQKKFLTAHPSGAFACVGEFERRVFVYHGAARDERELQSHTRRQHVVELGEQPLLGLRIAGDRVVLVLLPEQVVALSV
ncbi:hypothetical protein PybrP1_000966 [[Pythium] brassicae (nom. inval.)]|nr:hypothetical protein PybrP1_000966 [[Pythium] brassicae (nom. inval.)]